MSVSPPNPSNFEAQAVENWLARLFAAAGVAREAAATVAQALVEADREGLASHGVMQAPIYLRRLLAGSVSPASEGELVHDGGAVAVYDGGVVLGALAAVQAMGAAMTRAERYGISAVAVRRGFHFGSAGRYARMASEAGLIGIVMCNARAMMPAPGGAEPVVGNNPLAIALPTDDAVPLVLDMAMSETSIGRIRLAAAQGESLPDGWALDRDGRPTNDPLAALAGLLVPAAGAKGFGLALMIDLMSGLLSQGNVGTQVTSFYDAIEAPAHCSYLFIAIDPAHFGAPDFAAAAAASAAAIRASRPAPGAERVTLPGERKFHNRAAAGNHIRLAPTTLNELSALSKRLGVAALPSSNNDGRNELT